MAFSRLFRFFSDHLSITSSNSSAPPEKEESSSKKEESSSNSPAPKIMVSTSTSSIALLGVMLMASSTFIYYYFYSKPSSSNSSAPKQEESSSNSSVPNNEESSSNSNVPNDEESSSNSSAPKIKVSFSTSPAPINEESSFIDNRDHSFSDYSDDSFYDNLWDPSNPFITPGASTSTSSIQKRFKYDVFISFRGADTRKNFVDHLYEALKNKGIETFKDDVRIRTEKRISDELIKAIEDSRFCIIVFSKYYASSSWCLDELLKIIECKKTTRQNVYPIFYDVEPTEVRYQSGAVKNAFAINEQKEAAGKWREAMKEASNLAGWELKATANGDESKTIQIIVDAIYGKCFPLLDLSNKRLRFSPDPQLQQEDKEAKIKKYSWASTSTSNSFAPKIKKSSDDKRFKYDVFLSFRGEDTRKNIVDHLYEALNDKGIYTYKDDEKIQKGKRICDDLFKSIEDSKFYIIVFSKKYASSSWCLEELVKIMECHKMPGHTAYPLFYDVEPTEVRKQSGAVGEAFAKHENQEAAEKWREALKEAADLAGWELKNTLDGHQAKFIKKVVQEISLELRSLNFGFDEKLVGMETRIMDVVSSLEPGIDEVCMIGIKGMGGAGKTTIARAVFDHLSADFEAKSFVENVREVSNASMFGLKNLQEQILSKVLNERVTLDSVNDGKNMMKRRMCGKKVLLVLDDVDHIEQLKALAGEPKWFKRGSRILITTRDEQVLVAHRVNMIHDVVLLSKHEAISLFSRNAFGRENPLQGYEELSGEVVCYAAGLPLTVQVLGSFLCGKDKDEWEDAIERLKNIPLKETLEKLEVSYIGLDDDYKKMFLDIACILKGKRKTDAIRMLESCGFHARNGLKVLEQRSLITISKGGRLGMHDHIEEMGKNIVRRLHPDEPNKHSHLWKYEEIEDILANDMGTEATRYLKVNMLRGNPRILMKGLGKMKKLRYLQVFFAYYDSGSDQKFDDTSELDIPNSLKYVICTNYPFLHLPKTFQANNLVGLEMYNSKRMVQLREEGEKEVLKNLKFLSFFMSMLTTFDFRMTPNLETLFLRDSPNLVELCMPVSCQKLMHLDISGSKLRTFDLGLTPNLETLYLSECTHFVKLQVSVACPNLKILYLNELRLRSLDLELIPNLESLEIENCDELVEINGCLKKVGYLNLSGCLRFTDFKARSRLEPKVSRSSASLALFGESLDLCPLHPNNNLPKLRFRCYYEEDLPSSVGNIEKLISFGLCACTDLKKFSDIICSLQCLKKLTLRGDIPEFPKDLGLLECLEELCLYSKKIKHLPDSICMLKHLKYLYLCSCALEKLPEDLDQLECLERLDIRYTGISHLPQCIFGLKGLLIAASQELLQLYDFPSEIETRTEPIWWHYYME